MANAKQNHGQNHIHLTNCIHLRNYHHMRPMNQEHRHLMRDLAMLQRSRSLRDPSTSPPSWFSPSEHNNDVKPTKNGSRSEIGRLSKVVALESIADLELELADRVGNKEKKDKKRCKHVRRDRVRTQPVCSNSSVNSSSKDAIFGNELQNSQIEFLEDSRNVCGLKFNWSRIHNKGKSFLSCGLSDSKDSSNSQIFTNNLNSRTLNNILNSCTSSDSNASPLCIESENSYLNRFSGELGIFSNQSFRNEIDSDLGIKSKNRHQSLAQKYAPKSFKDIIGQNLVVQALTNATIKRKIGLIYLFHGSQGTGKSSIAKIFAKSLNCTSLNQDKPCNSCNSCNYVGKNKNIINLGPIESDKIGDMLENFNLISSVSSQYKVSIFNNCDSLKPDMWAQICKSIQNATKRMVFIFITNNNNDIINVPHGVLSKSQKFFFPKIKEIEIINYLNYICNNEGLEVDNNGLRLIALKSEGSLRDALMIIDQLSLLGQRIDLPIVQELIGVVSEDKLIDLLDLALSGKTANTVKTLREITESGVDPTSLMSQLAGLITDVLAGAAPLAAPKHGHRRLFFRHNTLGREEAERLRRALKILSQTEKQLRVSNDKTTWLTASLLQLAPDNFYIKSTPLSPSYARTPQFNQQCEIVEEDEDLGEHCLVSRNASLNGSETGQKKNDLVYGLRNEGGMGQKKVGNLRNGSRNEGEMGQGNMGNRVSRNGSINESETGRKKIGLRNEGETGHRKVGNLDLPNGSKIEGEMGQKKVGNLRNGSRKEGETGQNMSIVKGKVSLAQVINRFESGGWSRQKAVSIAEKLEKQNLRLESRSRSLFCWRAPRVSKAKMHKFKIRGLKQKFHLSNVVTCARGCLRKKENSL